MARRAAANELPPPCFARVIPGLERIAAEEITRTLGGAVKRTSRGVVVFRAPAVDASVLRLRTVEDVFLLAWGTDQLTYRAEDLDRIGRWTARNADWARLLRYHHAIRPKPSGKPSYRLVTQMVGKHAYRRVDAGKAFARGLEGKFAPSWRPTEENAAVEFWLSIDGQTAICGVRLSDRTMRHRTYKIENLPASLRPTLAAAMVYLGEAGPGQVVLDPMCGAGTILAEQLLAAGRTPLVALGGDLDAAALRAAGPNLRRVGLVHLARWDAARLPLPAASVDRLLCNPPFGKRIGEPEDIGPLYRRLIPEWDRVLRPKGRAVLLVGEVRLLFDAIGKVPWKQLRQLRLRILGQPADLTVWRKE